LRLLPGLLHLQRRTFRAHSGPIQGTFREYSGPYQGTSREHSGPIQRELSGRP
jgi:hypothetical protein